MGNTPSSLGVLSLRLDTLPPLASSRTTCLASLLRMVPSIAMSLPPLAERLRPSSLDELTGQQHLTGKGSILRKAIEQGKVPSMILWGPPGVGKTTIANIIANTLQVPFYTLSAISSGVKEVREVIEQAKKQSGVILFIDEIHRFNKGQQDALLGAVEKGIITLIGATTENPSFEVISALLSRCQVYILKHLEKEDLIEMLDLALKTDVVLKTKNMFGLDTTLTVLLILCPAKLIA